MSSLLCPLCGAGKARPFLRRPELRVLRCPCGLAFAADDCPAEAYGADYFRKWGNPSAGLVAMKKRTYRRILAGVTRPGVRRVVDVGCALGWSLDAAREAGLEPAGVEVSEHAAREAGRRHDVRRSAGAFEAGAFDAATLVDVIEHVRDPVGLLRETCRLLKPGGLLALTTPDLSSLSARWMGSRWPYVIPEHVVYFDRATIRRALRQAGFEPFRIGPARKSLRADYVASILEARGDALGRWSSRLARLLRGLEIGIATGDLMAVASARP